MTAAQDDAYVPPALYLFHADQAAPIHALKTLPPFFEEVAAGRKTVEVRRDDRGFQRGDLLRLEEYEHATGYTGRLLIRQVTHVLRGWGVEEGYVSTLR